VARAGFKPAAVPTSARRKAGPGSHASSPRVFRRHWLHLRGLQRAVVGATVTALPAAGPFRSLEPGCGQGFRLCLQAANHPQARFIGTDPQPDQAAHASLPGRRCRPGQHQGDVLELAQSPDIWLILFDLLAFQVSQQGHSEADLVACLDTSLQALDRKPMQEGQAMVGSDRQEVLETMAASFCWYTMPLMCSPGVLS